MTRPRADWPGDWPGDAIAALLAALTTWFSLWSWRGFVADPGGYLDPAFATVMLVGLAGVAVRSLRAPAVVVLLAQVVVVTLWLTHLWAPHEALGGWLPTASSLQSGAAVLRDGVAAAQSYAAPVPESAPQIHALLIAAGTVVALLVDFAAIGLRRVPVAGLPLLAVYTAPLSILDAGVPWWVFAAGAVGFLALVANDEGRRTARWGRAARRHGATVDPSGGVVAGAWLRRSARGIGLTATTLAVGAPLVVPTLDVSLLPGPGPGGEGGNTVTISNPMVNLRRDLVRGADVELLTVRTTSDDPSYLRVSVLDAFTGAAWKPSDRDIPPEQQADGLLPSPPGLTSGTPRREVRYDIRVAEAFESTWLPAPYPVTRIDVPGDWRYDRDTRDFISAVDGAGIAGLEYSLSALEISPDPAALAAADPAPDSIFTPYTDLPDDMSDTVGELARKVTAGADNRYAKAVRLQSWFRDSGEFTYSLERDPGTGENDLERFLAVGGRTGYCEQFAAAMALMGRTLGIPSRVAVGFLRPDSLGEGTYLYRAHDLHAWPEMYFQGAGWLRFEPTPADRAPEVPDYTSGGLDRSRPQDLPSARASAGALPPEVDRERLRGDQPAGGVADDSAGSGGAGYRLPAALGVVALLLAPLLLRTAVRRRRWAAATTSAAAAEAGWRELRDTALDLRLPWKGSVTLRTRARALASAFDSPADQRQVAASALDRLVDDVERARYSRDASPAGGRSVSEVRADVRICVDSLRAGAAQRRRRAATWLPASLWRNGARRRRVPPPQRLTAWLPEPAVDRRAVSTAGYASSLPVTRRTQRPTR